MTLFEEASNARAAMKATSHSQHRTARWRLLRWLSLGALLAVPWIAMQFTHEVEWTAFDFGAMAALLIVAGLAVELLLSRIWTPRMRLLVCLGLLGVVALVWIEGAVGIFH